MQKKLFQRPQHRYDIALKDGAGAHMITWATGLMVFFITLTLAANIAMSAMAKNWLTGLSGSLTVEIKPPLSAEGSQKILPAQKKTFEEKIEKVLWLSKQHPAVSDAHRLSDDEIKTLIQPWLGGRMLEDLPLPALIDIKLSPGADVAKLQADIRELVPAASIDTHDDTLDDVNTLIKTVRGFVLLLTFVITLLAIVAISGIVRAKFSIHRQEVETLHLLGANDEYIAQQFRHHTLRGTIKGAVGGVICTLVTLILIGAVTRTIDLSILPRLDITPLQWAALMISPVLAGAVVAHVTAQVTALKELARLP